MESNDTESTRLIKHMEVLTILLGACIYIWMEEDMEVLAIILSTYQNSLQHCCWVLHVPKIQLLMSSFIFLRVLFTSLQAHTSSYQLSMHGTVVKGAKQVRHLINSDLSLLYFIDKITMLQTTK